MRTRCRRAHVLEHLIQPIVSVVGKIVEALQAPSRPLPSDLRAMRSADTALCDNVKGAVTRYPACSSESSLVMVLH